MNRFKRSLSMKSNIRNSILAVITCVSGTTMLPFGTRSLADSCDAGNGCESGPCAYGCYAIRNEGTGDCEAGCADTDGNIIEEPAQPMPLNTGTEIGLQTAGVTIQSLDKVMGLSSLVRSPISRSRLLERVSCRHPVITVADFLNSLNLH